MTMRLFTSVQASLFIIMTFEQFSSSLIPHCQHYGVCWQHFRPRSSKKRKVYDSVRLIFGRRETFLVLTILNNTVHASSMFVQSSSGSTHLCLNSYSLAHSKMENFVCNFWGGEEWINYMIECILIHMLNQKWQPRMQFLRGRSVNKIHDWLYSY
jgi:hypothetical protein